MQTLKQIEWPTVCLALVIYGGWAALTFFHAHLPIGLTVSAGTWLVAWHSSLQHENLHGHPTPWQSVNTLLAFPPLSLWLPYHVYRSSHLNHHRAQTLARPCHDPESYYWTQRDWNDLGPIGQTLVYFQTTFAGRLLVGPAWNAVRLIGREIAYARIHPRAACVNWGLHLCACAMILIWVIGICKMSLWLYLLGIVYPATSLTLVRSFAEHRAARTEGEQTATVENARIFGLLFLFNNLHVVHHSRPGLPWYRIPAYYNAHRECLITSKTARVYDGYLEIARRYLLKSFDDPIHPLRHE